MAKVGIIGGSGLDDPKLVRDFKEVDIDTPYGKPSSNITCGKIGENEIFILSRHGRKHQIPPTQVNYRANIWALKKLNCDYVLATTACGSLREEIGRGHFVVVDQFIDFTRNRKITFHEHFEKDPVHCPMAEPFDTELRKILLETAKVLGLKCHNKGTVVTIEGPRFSTKAESHMFRQWGADVINMSIAPEAILANELGMKYAAIAMSTDYDCWKEGEEAVTWEQVFKVFRKNAENVKKLLVEVVQKIK
jgi:5'-methylthioadenosine phosphorylase